MTHTLTDAQSLTIADALTHTLTASDRRQRRIGDALFFRNPIRTERSGGRMGSQPTHTLSASEMRYFPTISDLTARAVTSSVNPRQRRGTLADADAPRSAAAGTLRQPLAQAVAEEL